MRFLHALMRSITLFVTTVNGFLSTYILVTLLVGAGLWFTIRTGVVQVTYLREMFSLLTEGATDTPRKGHISTFQAFCVSTASRVGVGNIAGIAIAVMVGGPGAVFWMWVIATLGSATGFIESTLAQIYKVPKRGGGFIGGPAYYIGNVLGSKFGATLFAVLLAVTYGMIFNSLQANTIVASLQASYSFDPLVTGIIIAFFTAIILLGGLPRIAKVVGIMVPIMASVYILLALVIMVMNATLLPEVFAMIFRHAFDFDAALGAGFATAVVTGAQRGLFSNEAGMGSVPNAAATADASHPVKQGLVQALGVYVDTLFVCTASAMIVLLCPDWATAGVKGIALAQHALVGHLGEWTNTLMSVLVIFFAFSSIIGNYFYGEVNMDFISRNRYAVPVYRILCVAMVFIGSVATLNFVWTMSDLFTTLMAMINITAILLLGKFAFAALRDFTAQKNAGIMDPEFDPKCLPSQKGILAWPRHKEEEIDQHR